MSGFGGGLLGGLLQGFGGVMLQKEQRDADDRRARAQQKQEVFQALIKDPNVSMGAKALALQGLIATTGERETRKGTQRTGGAKGPGSADILERIRRMPWGQSRRGDSQRLEQDRYLPASRRCPRGHGSKHQGRRAYSSPRAH